MLQDERIDSHLLAIKSQLQGLQSKMWTALPCIVESFDKDKMTVTLQAAIKANTQDIKTGKVTSVNLPIFPDVPVDFPGGGDFILTMPIAKGDEGIGIFSSRCIDAWWESGGVQPQSEFRMHDLSDCMFIPKIFSKPNVVSDFNGDVPELRNKNGSIKLAFTADGFEITGNLNVKGNINATGNITWPKGTFGANGAVVQGIITATEDVVAGQGGAGQVTLLNHKHTSGGPGSPTSSPTPGT